FVGEMKSVGNNAKFPVDVPGNVAIRQIGTEGVHPVLDARGDCDPDTILGVTPNKIYFPNWFAIDAVGKNFGRTIPGHELKAIGAEVRNQNVPIAGEG